MKFHLEMSSILPMLKFLKEIKNGKVDRATLCDIFNHPDYCFEIERYNIKSKKLLIDYFMQLNTIKEQDIPELDSPRKDILKHKHSRWLIAYQDPDYYAELYKKVISTLTDEALEYACETAKRGLAGDMEIGDVQAISTMSIGTSYGYVHQGAFHFDLMGIDEYGGLDNLPKVLAHEIHHLALMKHVPPFNDNLTLEEQFIQSFAYEGLAIKFCNNAKGVISKPLYEDRPINDGLDAFTMDYLNARFNEACAVFLDVSNKLSLGEMSKDDMMEHLRNYWWNRHTEEQGGSEEARLQQSLFYSFGNDLYGSIYDVYGAEVLFDSVRNPLKAVGLFKVIIKAKREQ